MLELRKNHLFYVLSVKNKVMQPVIVFRILATLNGGQRKEKFILEILVTLEDMGSQETTVGTVVIAPTAREEMMCEEG